MGGKGGPRNEPEKVVGRSYPKPKKGAKVTCLACNNGKVFARGGVRNCTACKGKGEIIAK
jgi:hypothetical protein